MFEIAARGFSVPVLGFGTNRLLGDECREAVADALAIGYRYIDTGQRYKNEAEVGAGLRDSGVPRGDVIISTKLELETPGAEVADSIRGSLRRLGTDYIDIIYMHWPNKVVPIDETLGAMVAAQQAGLARAVAVCNFTPSQLDAALEQFPIWSNQVEYHPYLEQSRMLDYVRSHDMVMTAYAPLARGRVVNDPVIQEIARGHQRTPSQVTLRWIIQQPAVGTIPKTASHDRRVENFDVFDFELTKDEMSAISALAEGFRIIDPPHAPAWEM